METIATLEELSDLRKTGTMCGFPPFVMNCSCFQVELFVLIV